MPIYDACTALLSATTEDAYNGCSTVQQPPSHAHRGGGGGVNGGLAGVGVASGAIVGGGGGYEESGGPRNDKLLYHLDRYYRDRVAGRRSEVKLAVDHVVGVIQDVLKEVESQEPRFISSLTENNSHYDGLQVTATRVGPAPTTGNQVSNHVSISVSLSVSKHSVISPLRDTFSLVLGKYITEL